MSEQKKLRLIYGGTFNPLHTGHTGSIAALSEQLKAFSTHFVLSARPPHKDEISASIRDRYIMLELGLSDYANFYADDTEIRRPSLSYTIDTVESFELRFPNSQLCLVIGADSLSRLHTWYKIEQWIDSINWIVLSRPGYSAQPDRSLSNRLVASYRDLEQSDGGAIWVFEDSQFDVSSTAIRQRLHTLDKSSIPGDSLLNTFLAPQVLDYILTHSLYRI